MHCFVEQAGCSKENFDLVDDRLTSVMLPVGSLATVLSKWFMYTKKNTRSMKVISACSEQYDEVPILVGNPGRHKEVL